MSFVMRDADIYKGLLKFIITENKIRYLTELMVAIDIESGKIWPNSRQHLLEILTNTLYKNMNYSDDQMYSIISDALAQMPPEQLEEIVEFKGLESILKKFDTQEGKRHRKTGDNRSGQKRSTEEIRILLDQATDEQKSVIDFANKTGEPLTLQGYAGCGKTTTIEQLYYSSPTRQQETLFTAFNKSIVRSVEYRNQGINAFTFDSLGCKYGMQRSPWTFDDLSTDPVDYSKISELLGIKPNKYLPGHQAIRGNKISRLCFSIVEAFCNSSLQELDVSILPKEIENDAARFELLHLSKMLWSTMVATPDTFVMPVIRPSFVTKHWSLMGGKLPSYFSRVFLDEAQDVNPAFAQIIDRSNHAQVISAGDHFQQLYTWRGAINAMKNSDQQRSITKSFRFGSSISSLSNKILSKMSAPPSDIIESFDDSLTSNVLPYEVIPENCDIILTRTRAEAFRLARYLSQKNKKFYLNLDMTEWKSLVSSALALYSGNRDVKHPKINCFDEWFQLVAYAETAGDSELLMCINIINEFSDSLENDLKTIEEMNQTYEEDAQIVLSTTHRIKGRDWKSVVIHDDFKKTISRAKNNPIKLDEEMRTLYVAITRARYNLYLHESLLEELKTLSINI